MDVELNGSHRTHSSRTCRGQFAVKARAVLCARPRAAQWMPRSHTGAATACVGATEPQREVRGSCALRAWRRRTRVVQRLLERLLGLVPQLELAEVALWSGGEGEGVLEAEDGVHLAEHLQEGAHLGPHLHREPLQHAHTATPRMATPRMATPGQPLLPSQQLRAGGSRHTVGIDARAAC